MRGTSGNDTLVGTAANDNLGGLAGDDRISGGAGYDILNGDDGADTLYGEAGMDTLIGGSGADLLDGGPGPDILRGGAGDDTYLIDDLADVATENDHEGIDTVKSSIIYTLPANVENLLLTGTATLKGSGNAWNNALTGNSAKNILLGGGGNDLLDGGSNADILSGGAGDDRYVVDNTGDVVSENADEGSDTVRSSVTYTLAANVENLELTGFTTINGTGNALNNILIGNGTDNTLDGGIGSDTLAGGLGNDTYIVDDPSDMVVENPGEGTDTVKSSLNYVLGAHLEHLVLTGSAAINGTGNGLGNTLTGNSADNTLSGGAGADTIIANAGDDTLDGGTEADQLKGGTGDDTYIVDNSGDVVTEKLNEGMDTVQSTVTFTLGANLERLVLTGTAAINGTGNGLNNVLIGNGANNTLNGGTGADTTYGGAGNDLYIVDNSLDAVVENVDEGVDSVHSSVTWTLSANSENLALTGSSAINGTGNGLDNLLTGNSATNVLRGDAGNDVLDGKAGADTLYGGVGDDTYWVDNTADVVGENPGEGVDTVQSSVTYTLAANLEHLTLTGTSKRSATGNALDNTLTGNSAANTLTGLAGDDHLDGGAGADTLRGGSGGDRYLFNRSDGFDLIQEQAGVTGENDSVQFGPDLDPDRLWFRRSGDDLSITVLGGTDGITLQKWYSGPEYRVEEFHTTDGSVLYASQVQRLVQAMAAFNPPAAGETELSPQMREHLEPVLAAAWDTHAA